MGDSFYSLIPGDGGDDDSEKDYSWPKPQRSLSAGWKCLLVTFVTTLLASVTLNALLIYRQSFNSWEFLDEIPSQYGATLFCSCRSDKMLNPFD